MLHHWAQRQRHVLSWSLPQLQFSPLCTLLTPVVPLCVSLCLLVCLWAWLLLPTPELLRLAHLHVIASSAAAAYQPRLSSQSSPDRSVTPVPPSGSSRSQANFSSKLCSLCLSLCWRCSSLCSRFTLARQPPRSAHQPPAYPFTLSPHSQLIVPVCSATGSSSPRDNPSAIIHLLSLAVNLLKLPPVSVCCVLGPLGLLIVG